MRRLLVLLALVAGLLPAAALADPVTHLDDGSGLILYTGHADGDSQVFVIEPGDYTLSWRAIVPRDRAWCVVHLFVVNVNGESFERLVGQPGSGALGGEVTLSHVYGPGGLRGGGNYWYRVFGCGEYTLVLRPVPPADPVSADDSGS